MNPIKLTNPHFPALRVRPPALSTAFTSKANSLAFQPEKENSPIRLRMKIFVWILYVLAFVFAIGIGYPYGLGLILLLSVLCPGSSRGSFGGL